MATAIHARRSPSAFAAVVAAHLVLLSLVLAPRAMPVLREGASGAEDRVGARLEVALLEVTAPLTDLAEPRPFSPPLRMAVNPLPLPAFDIGVAEQTPEERLQTLYVGQVRARIERAWQDARTPDDGQPGVPCRALITQGPRGDVQDVEIRDCRAPLALRRRLSRVIRGVSPLPAPPASLPWGARLEISLDL